MKDIRWIDSKRRGGLVSEAWPGAGPWREERLSEQSGEREEILFDLARIDIGDIRVSQRFLMSRSPSVYEKGGHG
jgi:hypothetical protein